MWVAATVVGMSCLGARSEIASIPIWPDSLGFVIEKERIRVANE